MKAYELDVCHTSWVGSSDRHGGLADEEKILYRFVIRDPQLGSRTRSWNMQHNRRAGFARNRVFTSFSRWIIRVTLGINNNCPSQYYSSSFSFTFMMAKVGDFDGS